jgi:hypothetical protein
LLLDLSKVQVDRLERTLGQLRNVPEDYVLTKSISEKMLEPVQFYAKDLSLLLIRDRLRKKREYQSIFGHLSDSYNEIERLGINDNSKLFTYVLSFEESLAWILSLLCGCDENSILGMKDYMVMSRLLLKPDVCTMEKGLPIGKLFGLDEKLDKIFIRGNIFIEPTMVTSNFISNIYDICVDLIARISVCFVHEVRQKFDVKFIKKSYSISSLVCSSNSNLQINTLDIKYKGKCHTLKVKRYTALEYLGESFKDKVFSV